MRSASNSSVVYENKQSEVRSMLHPVKSGPKKGKIPKNTVARQKRTNTIVAYLFLAPVVLIALVFSVFPILYSFGLSLFQWDMLTSGPQFVGLRNYEELISSGELYHTLWLTTIYCFFTVVPSVIIGLSFALLLDRKFRGIGFYRSLFLAPMLVSSVAISSIWMWLFHNDYGAINELLGLVGIQPIPWLNSADTALWAVIIMGIWSNVGFVMVLYIAGLQNISNDLIEAARVDGAGTWTIIQKIKVPLLAPTTFVIIVTQTIDQYLTFASIDTLTGGGPANSTRLMVSLLYEKAFQTFEMGYASAISVIIFIVVLILTLINLKIGNKKVFYR